MSMMGSRAPYKNRELELLSDPERLQAVLAQRKASEDAHWEAEEAHRQAENAHKVAEASAQDRIAQLEAKEKAFEAEKLRLAKKEQELLLKEADLNRQNDALAEWDQSLDDQKQALSSLKSDHEAKSAQLTKDRNEFNAFKRQLDARAAILAENEAKIREFAKSLG